MSIAHTVHARTNNGATGVTNPVLAHKGWIGDFALLKTPGPLQDVQFVIDGWVPDADADNRLAANISTFFRYDSDADEYTQLAIYFRPTGVAAWTRLDWDINNGTSNWAQDPAEANQRFFTITTEAGTSLASGWEIGFQLFSGDVDNNTVNDLPTFNPA